MNLFTKISLISIALAVGVFIPTLTLGQSSELEAGSGVQPPEKAAKCEKRDESLMRAYDIQKKIGQPISKVLITGEIYDFFNDLRDDILDNQHNLKAKFSAEFYVERFEDLDVQITSRIRNDLRYSGAALTKSNFLAEKLYEIVERISAVACEGNFRNCSGFSMKVTLDDDGFRSESRFGYARASAVNAARFAESYNLENEVEGCVKGEKSVVYDSTHARSENDQVFIVTHIPRSVLNPLITKRSQ